MRFELMGRWWALSSAAAAREKLVTNTASVPYLSTARRTWRATLVVLPVPGGPKILYSRVTECSCRPMSSRFAVAPSIATVDVLAVLGGMLTGIILSGWQFPSLLIGRPSVKAKYLRSHH